MSIGTDRLKPGFSLYCDLLRFLAAAVVLLGHAAWGNFSAGYLWQIEFLGSPAVVIFFVLSGYIICYVAFTRETTLIEYSAARLARLYSVVIPAIALTFILDTIGRAHNPVVYSAVIDNIPVWRGLSALLFLSDVWFAQLGLFSNTAYWSLPFEFWYYVLFGSAFLLRGRSRIIVIILAALIAGPLILITFPIWLAGAGAYWMSRRFPAGKMAGVLFIASLAVVALGIIPRWYGFQRNSVYLPPQLSWGEYIIGAGIAINFYAASDLEFGFLRHFKVTIRRLAGITFSLYLFHLPILFFTAAFVPTNIRPIVRYTILLATAFIAPALLSLYTENRKDRWKDRFVALFQRI